MTDANTIDSQSLKNIIIADITIATNNLLSITSQLNYLLNRVNSSSTPLLTTLITTISSLMYTTSLLVNKITPEIDPLLEKIINYNISLINNIHNIIIGFISLIDDTNISFTDLTGHIVSIIGGLTNMIIGIISMMFGIINIISVPPVKVRTSIINIYSGLVQNIMGLTMVVGTTNNIIHYTIYTNGSVSEDIKNDINTVVGGLIPTIENITDIVNISILVIKSLVPRSAHTISNTIGILAGAASSLLSLISNLNNTYNRIDEKMTQNFATLLSSTSTMVGTVSSILNSINTMDVNA